MRRRVGYVVLGGVVAALLAGCGKRAPQVAQGEGFHFAIPKGYSQRDGAALKLPPRALAVGQDQRAAADYFIASVVVTPIAPSTPPFDNTSDKVCAATAQALATQQDAAVLKTGIVTTPSGKTCQIDIKANKSNQGVRFTVMAGPKAMWALTCNHDPRDTAAVDTCQQVIESWKFE
jgi:hypothetical protein